MVINLGKYRRDKTRVFSGREEGKEVRKKLNLDVVDVKENYVNVVIPPDTLSMNTSFFLGLFGKSVRTLGEIDFKNKYHFDCGDVILRSVNDGIIRALKSSNPLD